MLTLISSFVIAAFATLMLVWSGKHHTRFSQDGDMSGPQKFHARPVPRIGGLAVFLGVAGTALVMLSHNPAGTRFALGLLGCSLPAFLSGLAEDITKNVSPRRRLVFTAAAALLAFFLIDGRLDRIGYPPIDHWMAIPAVSLALTVLTITGVTNAVNIIDGFNGLAAMCVLLMVMAIAYVAFQVGDMPLFWTTLCVTGAVAGFFFWNYPAGLIFLGDGGAYFLGFIVSELGVMLFHRNPAVSPVFSLLICIYPVVETLFSIYRKRVIRKMSPGVPDGVHLHMLIYKRLLRWAIGRRDAHTLTRRNAQTSPYLWFLCMVSVLPATLFWNDTLVLTLCIAVFAVIYVTLYWRIVRFRTPRWMIRHP